MVRKYKLPIIIIIAFIVAAIVIGYYTEYLWYQSLDLTQVFLKPIIAELLIKVGLWILGFLFLVFNLLPMADQFRIKRPKIISGIEVLEREYRLSKKILMLIAFGVSVFWAWVLPDLWDKFYLFTQTELTGQVDPILGRDLSYYLFNYPFYSLLSASLASLFFLTTIVVIAGYFIGGALNFAGLKTRLSPKAASHFSILLAIILLWYAATRGLAMADVLVSPSYTIHGAGYTEVKVQLPLIRIQQIAAVLLAVVALANIRLKKFRLLVAAPVLLFAISIIGGLGAGIVQKFIVTPNQLVKETPYIEHHIQATRDAYGLSKIEQIEYAINPSALSSDVVKDNPETIDNIRLLDYRPLKQHYQQNQSLRLYYEFKDIDIDRYLVNNQSTQVMLSLRELNIESLPPQAQTQINRHFKYTHGYGAVMSPVNKVTANGHPTYYLKDIPVKPEVDIPLTQPEIYFGEMTNQFVIVNTTNGEFGYPVEGTEKIVNYQGTDGVKLSAFRRLLFAINLGKPILLFSDEITADSRILYHRNIVERISKAAPFITLDRNPYPVIAEGKVYWIVDGYTTSGLYPYAQPSGSINYIRNSVKIVVDAYNGNVALYNFDPDDPLIKAWSKTFPGLIKERSEFPQALLPHILYPVDYFEVQASLLRNYHMTNSRDFYNRENVWEIAVEKYGGTEVKVEPYYINMQLPGSADAEFILKMPFTPLNRNNMVGWLAAGNDGANYGKLLLYTFPRGQLVEGPSQIEAYIDQDPYISQQLTLWNQGGTEVVRGNLLTIPINNSILYVEPLYILSQNRSIPEMRRIIMYYNGTLVMESTLEQGLTKLFGAAPSTPGTPETPDPGTPQPPGTSTPPEGTTINDLIRRINDVYESQELAAREGRWADYGTYGNQLKDLLQQLTNLAAVQ